MKIGNFLISRDKPGIPDEVLATVDADYEKQLQAGKQLILGTLSARSGTRWLGDVFEAHQNATGITERDFDVEAFYRYIKYNNLPIDTRGIITLIKYGILCDWKRGEIAFVNSPFFSHGIKELWEELKPKRIIFGLNDPKFTVQSIFNKGFFKESYFRDSSDLALGSQPAFSRRWNWLYLFGRVVPNGEFYKEWEKLTRIGKIAWWGTKMNTDIWSQLKTLPPEAVFVFHLKEADQNYAYYQKLAKEFGLAPALGEKQFLAVKKQTVRVAHNKPFIWSEKEQEEFEKYAKDWYELYAELCLDKPYVKN